MIRFKEKFVKYYELIISILKLWTVTFWVFRFFMYDYENIILFLYCDYEHMKIKSYDQYGICFVLFKSL